MSRSCVVRAFLLTSACTLASAVTGACVPSLQGNTPREPQINLPTSFDAAHADPATAGAASVAHKKWSEFFHSPELRSLIEIAIANNRELNIQMQEIIIAKNEVAARDGEVLPKLNAAAGAGFEKTGKYTSQGASDEATGLPEHLGNFAFGLSASWEVDIWKKLRNASKAAAMRYLASIEGKNFMTTQIVAEIARSYFELIALDNELEILNRNIELQTRALEVVKLEKEAARVTELAVQRFEAEVLKNKSRIYAVQQDRIMAENRINFLVGRYPEPVRRDATEFKATLPDGIQTGLPTQLLDNRPDVRQAALELEASKLDVSVAKSRFYPSLSIDAQVGFRSFNMEHLLATPESLVYGVAAGLTAPLLNRSAITAMYRSANAKQLQAVFNYEKVVLQAFTDVANQLAMIDNLQKSYDLQAQQVDTLTRAVEISNLLFQSARADYMEVLLTRRDSLEAQMELVETKKHQFHAMVSAYQALGGGWQPELQSPRQH